ncbi:clostripain-related cysteine peptidase [Bacteroides sp. 224]|uniref:clostripain-related cysteine peptidase n=1 Tax=Bacteroides sp. 224 TaxID=2302936 RepID=UPI0013CF963B|nr:clostripain-related cysteine peptidase [Bacteroides sp. 224]NDV64249.1 hypothetical protein [Bacteroides sp. 224]
MKQLRKHILWLFIALFFSSCSKNEQPATPNPTRLLLAYIGVDNNLNSLEAEKLDALRAGWTGKPTDHILAYVDKAGVGASLYALSAEPNSEPLLLESYGKENSADAATLSRVITDVVNRYKADSYGLLVFSHASGWLPEGMLNSPTRSILIDGKSEMSLTDFAAALPDGVFNYIVFESCFMAGIEVAYELRNKTPYIFASSAEILHPGFAPTYTHSTQHLFNANLPAFGQQVFNQTLTYAENELLHSGTYSVIRTEGLEQLATFIKDHCDFTQPVDLTDIQHFDRSVSYHLFFDFNDYYGRLLTDDSQKEELNRLLSEYVIWKAATNKFMAQEYGYNGFTITSHSGLTCYIAQERFPKLNEAYTRLAWSEVLP